MPSPRDVWLAENPIRAWRQTRGYSMQALAEELGTVSSRVSDWELGKRHPRYEKLAALAELMPGQTGAAGLEYRLRLWKEKEPAGADEAPSTEEQEAKA